MIRYCIKHYFSKSVELHPYLLNNLQRRGLLPLKNFQVECFQNINNNFNFLVNSCTGSGKTLSYLIPMINKILINKQNITPQENPEGGVILTLNKQLVAQVYRQVKDLDIENKIKVLRIGSQPQINKQSSAISLIHWNQIDILISTPQALINNLTIYKNQKKNKMNPEFLVIDEADILLQIDKNVRKNTDKAIQFIRQNSTNPKMIKYMLAASSFPKKFRGQDGKSKLEANFKTLKFIQGQNKHKLPERLQLFYIQILQGDETNVEMEKRKYLKRILSDRKKQRIIIFCKEKSTIKQLHTILTEEMQTKCQEYYAELKSEERSKALLNFDNGNCRILISSDLGARGLDFTVPVDCIVEYNMAENITHFVNRAGRTARNGHYGQVITFVEKKNQQFFKHLRSLKEQGSQFDQLFSRKRSYSKLYKQDKEN